MDSKVWVGLGVAALAGAAYYLTRPIDVEPPSSPSVKSKSTLKPQHSSSSPRSTGCHSSCCSDSSSINPLTQSEDGVLTKEAVANFMAIVKANYWSRMSQVSREFKESRRKVGYEDLQLYVEEIKKYQVAQNRTFDEVFLGTLEELAIERKQIADFNEKYGREFFYKQLASIALSTVKPPKDMTMEPARVVMLLEEKVALLSSLLPQPGQIAPEDLLINSFIVDDMLFAHHGIEDEEIVAQAQRFKDDEGVKTVMAKLNALVPR